MRRGSVGVLLWWYRVETKKRKPEDAQKNGDQTGVQAEQGEGRQIAAAKLRRAGGDLDFPSEREAGVGVDCVTQRRPVKGLDKKTSDESCGSLDMKTVYFVRLPLYKGREI